MNTKIIELDINERLNEPLTAKQGDTKSRFLLFHLLDNNKQLDLTEKSVRCFINKPDKKDIFNDLIINDAKRGYCTLELTSQSLAVSGTANMELMISQSDKKLTSIPFSIDIIKSINNEDSIVSTNEFSSLMNGLSKIEAWDKEFEDKSGKLEELYTPRLSELSSQMEDIVQQSNIKFNEVEDKKADKQYVRRNTSVQPINVSEMDNETKALFTGGNVAIVGKNSVANDNIVNGVIGNEKFMYSMLEATPSKNIFDKRRVELGKAISWGSGNIQVNADYFLSDYILIKPSTTYTTQKKEIITFFDINKTYISGIDGAINYRGTYTFTTQSNAVYMRISTAITLLDLVQIELGSFATLYEGYLGKLSLDTIKDGSLSISKMSFIPLVGQKCKNMFDKSKVTVGRYVSQATGVLGYNKDYSANDFIQVKGSVSYVLKFGEQLAWYDVNKVYISGAKPTDGQTITSPHNALYIRFTTHNNNLDTQQLEEGTMSTDYESYIGDGVDYDGSNFKKNSIPVDCLKDFNLSTPSTSTDKKLYTLNDAWTSWCSGEKFPIALFGDSTTEGLRTTGNIPNVLGTDNISPNSYCKVLEDMMRKETGNNVLRVYNAGFSGQTIDWASKNLDAEFGAGTPYADVKMVGISFGINDRGWFKDDFKRFRTNFKEDLITIINYFKNKNIQPFLLTTQAYAHMVTPYTNYPKTTTCMVETIANEVKRELAIDYNLEIIDINSFTEKVLIHSKYRANEIMGDFTHFGDLGHKFEAGMLFKEICPKVEIIRESGLLGMLNQKVSYLREDDLKWSSDRFKMIYNTTKSDVNDIKIFDIYIFNDSKRQFNLKTFISSTGTTYIKLNGIKIILNNVEQIIGELELGLHHLEVYTGSSNKIDFKGFEFI